MVSIGEIVGGYCIWEHLGICIRGIVWSVISKKRSIWTQAILHSVWDGTDLFKAGDTIGSVSIIGGSDGPTSVFIAGSRKKTLKQKIKIGVFEQRKKLYAKGIKPGTHTMAEVAVYAKDRYDFVELSKDHREYQEQYKELLTTLAIRH